MAISLTRIIIALLGIGLTVLIILAVFEAPINESFVRITQDFWGWSAFVDLYLGFILIAIVIAAFEENKIVAAFWILPVFFLGNIWSALWFVLKLPTLANRLKRHAIPK
ncbi:MAG: hypothetical protein ABJN04_12925 [Hyphomicrobiales bacterium]